MNNIVKILLMLSILWITSCSSPKPITFSNEKWSFSLTITEPDCKLNIAGKQMIYGLN